MRTPKVSLPERDSLYLSLDSALTSFITKQKTNKFDKQLLPFIASREVKNF